MRSKVKRIVTDEGDLEEAFEAQSVVLTLEDEIDISRGDMIVRKNNVPTVDTGFDAILCWMDGEKTSGYHEPLPPAADHPAGTCLRATSSSTDRRKHLHSDKSADSLELNEIGRVQIETASPSSLTSTTATGRPAASSS